MTNRIWAGVAVAAVALLAIAGCSAKDSNGSTSATRAPRPVGSEWTAEYEALIPENFPADLWDEDCVTTAIESVYPSPKEFLDAVHASGPRAIVTRTGVTACYLGS